MKIGGIIALGAMLGLAVSFYKLVSGGTNQPAAGSPGANDYTPNPNNTTDYIGGGGGGASSDTVTTPQVLNIGGTDLTTLFTNPLSPLASPVNPASPLGPGNPYQGEIITAAQIQTAYETEQTVTPVNTPVGYLGYVSGSTLINAVTPVTPVATYTAPTVSTMPSTVPQVQQAAQQALQTASTPEQIAYAKLLGG